MDRSEPAAQRLKMNYVDQTSQVKGRLHDCCGLSSFETPVCDMRPRSTYCTSQYL